MSMENLDQLQKEWSLITASRELLSIIKRNPNIKYEDAIKFAKQISPEILNNTRIGANRRNRLEKIYDKYVFEAIGKSRQQGSEINPEALIEIRITEIERLLQHFTQDDESPQILKREADDLKMLLRPEFDRFLELRRVTENQAILRDAFRKRPEKIWIDTHLGKFNTYVDKENHTVFRVAVLHPNPSEAITGTDLIYEQYDESTEKVRIVAIQYKIWENEVLYFSQAGNLNDQLKKMAKCFCGDNYCKDSSGNNISTAQYRLPYCCAFLKPTDKLQNPNKLTTTGYHLPICKVDSVKQKALREYMISLGSISQTAIKAQTFEELFNAEILGSRWLDKQELEELYRKTKVLEPSERIILYAQNVIFDTDDEDHF